MELEFRHLRVLIAVADEGSITRAAAALGMSQPSLTAQVQRIERALGAPLFERGRAGVVPTGFGRTVLSKARSVVSEMAGLQSVAPPGAGSTGGVELHLGCYPGALASAVVPRLVEAHDEPLRVHVHSDPSAADLLARVRAGRLDAAIVVEPVGFEVTPPDGLLREVVVPVEPKFVALCEDHPLAAEEEVDLAALADENWVVDPHVDAGLIAALRWACGEAGFEPRITHEISDASSAREFIITGQCVSMAQPTSSEGRGLVVRPMRGDPITARVDLAWRRPPPPVEPALLRRLIAESYLALTVRNPSYARWWAENGVTLT
ncbi:MULTISPECIES: LysR family transcriptional regulator [Actinokineospora]|nr:MULTISPECIES: LysR family transcriptional regulator [Actinokineospora]